MRKNKYLYLFCFAVVVLLFLLPSLINNTYYRMIFNQTLVNILVVVGLNFITGLTGDMNLGMAGILAVGAYTSALLTTKFALSPWLTLILAAIMGIVVGFGLGWPSLRIKGIYLALTTIGFGEIVRQLLNNMADITGGTHGVMRIPPYDMFGIKLNTEESFYYFLLTVVILMVALAVRIVNSKWGRAFKAVRDNVQAVETCGINTAEIKIIAFVLSTVYASIAGALYAHMMGYINPADFSFDLSVKYLMMLMLGGIGSVPGSIIGGIVITMLPEYLRFLKDYYWLVFSISILLTVVILPHGLISVLKPLSAMLNKMGGKERSEVAEHYTAGKRN